MVSAEVASRQPLIAWLSGATAQLSKSFVGGMSEVGHVRGYMLHMIYCFTDGYQVRLRAMTEEALESDFLVAPVDIRTGAATKVTSKVISSIPILPASSGRSGRPSLSGSCPPGRDFAPRPRA
jgi:hypothetical protein